jgi:hypothetical protein
VTVIGITGNSFAQPYIVLKASLATDPGYFGEKLARGRQEIVRVWQTRSARLEPKAKETDILGALVVAGDLFGGRTNSKKLLLIYSDMKQATADLNLERINSFQRSAMIVRAKQRQLVADLNSVQVYVLGAHSAMGRIFESRQQREFWQEYFENTHARLISYSLLRDTPEAITAR